MAKGKVQAWLTNEGLLKIEGWARDGLVDEQIAKNIGISRATLSNWKKKHPLITRTLAKGKEVVDREVENALLKKALGYTYEEVITMRQEVEEDVFQDVEVKRIKKQVPPDTTAIIFWLKNRKQDTWRDRREIDHSGEMTQNIEQKIDLSHMTDEELEKALKKYGNT
ncbi:hypothetical protein [Bacillus cereus]|uniref:hypothetical protein n=1 Tax=Bacillus cereus TaxID=1396 RepID=UPI000BF6ED74|nr:hypothetical protein [Bacillus cereus]PEQ68950.1 hypothetical protein CN469_02125 [Bacillus cereus]